MNSRAHLIRRLAGDFVQRMRIALGSSGDDAAPIVDKVTSAMADEVAGDVCATLGIEYEGRESQPKPDGKPGGKARAASPWQKAKGLRYGKRPEVGKDSA